MDVATYDTGTPTVVVAGDEGLVEWVETGIDDAEVGVVDDPASVPTQSVDAADCLVVGDSPTDGPPVDLLDEVRGRTPDLPVVYAPTVGSGEDAKRATGAGVTHYLPRDATDAAELRERVADAVDRYDRDRQRDRERSMFRDLLNDVPLSIYFKDEAARHVCVSRYTRSADAGDVIGRTDLELSDGGENEAAARRAYEDDLEVIETGEPLVGRIERQRTPSGDSRWHWTTKVPRRDEDGEVTGLVGLTRDITDAKERELELESQKRQFERFASFASHDLRNPVTVAAGYLELAMEEGDEGALEEVAESLDRMDRLIDDLLEVAESEGSRGSESWTSLPSTTKRAWTAVESGDATLESTVPETAEVQAVPGGLQQLLQNLFDNAVEHAADDGTPPTVTVGLTETGFYVADDGDGIAAEDRSKVFEYGYTTDGTGVGLAIVREIAENHGWTIDVVESEDGGARFEFDGVLTRVGSTDPVVEGESVELDREANVDGATPVGGATASGSGEWTIRGGGRNFWGSVDEYYAVYGTVEGDARVEGRIRDLDAVNEYSKAVLVVADRLEPGRPLVGFGATATHGPETLHRDAPGSHLQAHQFESLEGSPRWYRVDRVDDRVSCSVSEDGEDWELLDRRRLDCSDPVVVGIAVCSHDESRACEATIDGVRAVELRRGE